MMGRRLRVEERRKLCRGGRNLKGNGREEKQNDLKRDTGEKTDVHGFSQLDPCSPLDLAHFEKIPKIDKKLEKKNLKT